MGERLITSDDFEVEVLSHKVIRECDGNSKCIEITVLVKTDTKNVKRRFEHEWIPCDVNLQRFVDEYFTIDLIARLNRRLDIRTTSRAVFGLD